MGKHLRHLTSQTSRLTSLGSHLAEASNISQSSQSVITGISVIEELVGFYFRDYFHVSKENILCLRDYPLQLVCYEAGFLPLVDWHEKNP